MTPRGHPDAREGPHVSGPPGEEDLTVAALQDGDDPHVHPALAGLGRQEVSGCRGQAGDRAEGGVGQQAAGGGGGGGGGLFR